MKGRHIVLAALLVVAGSAGAWLARARAPSTPPSAGTGSAPAPERSPAERLAMLDNSLKAIADGVRDAPRGRWDPVYVVAQVGKSPDTLRRWVKENTVWIPYRGVLRGPVGVLMDRQGNSLDRAVLLARLLAEAGHVARLAHAELPVERASQELPGLVARRPSALGELASVAGTAVPVKATAERYRLDGPAIERMLDYYEAGTDSLLRGLDRRTTGQATRLLSTVARPDPATEWRARYDTALAALQDHWWVQVREGESWIDLDLLDSSSGGAGTSPAVAMETVGESEIPVSLFHSIAIRVIEERLAGGTLTELRTLEHILRPSELIGRPVVLQFWPTAWPNRAPPTEDPGPSTRRLALEQEAWSAALAIGSDVVASTKVAASADAGKRAPGWTGLGGAIASGLGARDQSGQREPDSLLTAVWIEYRIDVPGREPRVLRRRVFDLIGPATRKAWSPARTVALDEGQRLTRSLSLMMRTEILPVAAQLAREYVLHLGGTSLLANAGLLHAVSRPDFGVDQHATDSLLRQTEPGVSPLYTLAVLRHQALGERTFLDRPAILTRHQYPTAKGDGIALDDAIDIVANEVGVVLGESDGFAVRLAQGVWDTNLEALLGAGSRAAANTALAYDAPGDWKLLGSSLQQRPASSLPADEAALLQHELDDGYAIVAPDGPVELKGEKFTGWWRIHPETGDALGIAGNGWGQAAPGYAIHIGTVVEIAKPFVFTYALCQYIPQAANSLNIIGYEFWQRGLAPSWTTPVAGKDFGDVAVENNRRCVIEAILAGFVATAPILLQTMRSMAYRNGAELPAWDRLSRNRALTKRSIERPPGTSPRPKGYPAPGGAAAPGPGPRGTLPGGAVPPGANPLGKTEGLAKTQPGPPTPGSNPQESLKRAAAVERAAYRKSAEATGDWIRYRDNMPGSEPDPRWRGDPSKWNQSADDILKQRMRETRREWFARERELAAAQKASQDAAGPAPKPAPRPAPRPNPAECLPKCGNENPTVPVVQPAPAPGGALEVGSAGAASSFFPISWPSGLGQ